MKKICHIELASPYQDGMGYQENILPKKHAQLGFNVSIITGPEKDEGPELYVNSDGVEIHKLKKRNGLLNRLPYICGFAKNFIGFYKELELIKPDYIFVHSPALSDYSDLLKYKKNHDEVRIFADNHFDFYNYPIKTLKSKIQRYTYDYLSVYRLSKVCEIIWGVTPWRVDYLKKVWHVPSKKTGLLVMGGDEDYIDFDHRGKIREAIRKQYGIPLDAKLIVSGGRIEKSKNIHLLVEAIAKMHNPHIFLLLFGNMTDEVKELCKPFLNDHIIMVGWIKSNDVYNYLLSSDLGVFPGTHSVLWEQACASGLPCIFKDWDGGFNHVFVNGNSYLLKDISVDSLLSSIQSIIENPENFSRMKLMAVEARDIFLYKKIAKKAILWDE